MSQKSITDLNLNSLTISNSNYSNTKGYTAQASVLTTNNAGELLVDGYPISSGGGSGGVDNIIAGDGIDVKEVTTGTFEITNTGVTSLIEGDGITINSSTGDITITSTVNPTDYYTIGNADATFQTLADSANYSTTTEANALYQPQAAMANYSTTTEANASYAPINKVGGAKTVTTIVAGTAQYSIHALNNVTITNFVGSYDKTAYTMTSNTIGQPSSFGCNIYFQSTDGTDTVVEPNYTYLGLPPTNDEIIVFAITAVNF